MLRLKQSNTRGDSEGWSSTFVFTGIRPKWTERECLEAAAWFLEGTHSLSYHDGGPGRGFAREPYIRWRRGNKMCIFHCGGLDI